ncbi:TlpA family protein disulfide reductase [Sphingobacterium sp. GVS05A]|uniref:TlpA family protein disulfide reductase n=1 Tax=Sphingobacterium sp. GVS05A TaxID=2862679 RepID=UPI001CBF6659|nr:TlpA disulfide reductase family protein [Sphingobacterium sp. GVS05A]
MINDDIFKAEVKNGTGEFVINKILEKGRFNFAQLALSDSAFTNREDFSSFFRRHQIFPPNFFYSFIIDSSDLTMDININTHQLKVYGSDLNKQFTELETIAKTLDLTHIPAMEEQIKGDNNRMSEFLKILTKYSANKLSEEYLTHLLENPSFSFYNSSTVFQNKDSIYQLIQLLRKENSPYFDSERVLKKYQSMVTLYKPKENVPVSNFTVTNSRGEKKYIRELYNSTDYLVIDFWGTWCGPCIAQHPELQRIVNEYKNNGKFKFVGIAVNDKFATWKQYLEKHIYTYENYIFEDRDYPNLRKELGIYSFPRYVIVNTKENKVVRSNFQIDQLRGILNML